MKNELEVLLNFIYPLSPAAVSLLEREVKEVVLPKGYKIFQENKRNNHIYLLEKGIARVYYTTNGNEVVLRFYAEGEILYSMKSMLFDKAGYESIEFLERAKVYQLNYSALQRLYNEHAEIANWGRRWMEVEAYKTEERLRSILFKSASERYEELLSQYPTLLQRVSLGDIASYLGVTQVTLSRIRANK